jgi:hypothetical protein
MRAGGLATLAMVGAVDARAQVGGDSAAQTTGDTLRPGGVLPRPDSAAGDTTSPPIAPAGDPAPPSPSAAALPGPAAPEATDTTLARVCKGAVPGELAPGLLAVVFRAGTTRPEAVAAARAVGGTIVGMSDAGEVYVDVTAGGAPLAAAADQLIRQNPVSEVTLAACPAGPAAPTPTGPSGGAAPARPDSGASGGTVPARPDSGASGGAVPAAPDTGARRSDSTRTPAVTPGP